MTGSHATLAGWEPKTCCICGNKIVVSKPGAGLRFHLNDHTKKALAWHVECERTHGWPK